MRRKEYSFNLQARLLPHHDVCVKNRILIPDVTFAWKLLLDLYFIHLPVVAPRIYRSLQAYCKTLSLRRSNLHNDARDLSSERWNYWARNLAESSGFHVTLGIFYMLQICEMLYFPSEGRRAEDFFALKIDRFEPANLGTKGQHATSRTP